MLKEENIKYAQKVNKNVYTNKVKELNFILK